jgi:hypothetical protein
VGSGPEQVKLFRYTVAGSSGDTAESFKQTLDAMVDGWSGMAAATGEFCARDAFEFEFDEKLPFPLGQPSPVLAVIEESREQNVRMGIFAALWCFSGGRRPVQVIREVQARFANGPAECTATHLSRDGERKMRPAQVEFLGMEEFQKSGKEVLSGVLAGKRRKCCADLGGGAVDGWNKNQQ